MMDEPPPKVLDLLQQLEDSLTRAKEARDTKIVSGDEHPSGLRDALETVIFDGLQEVQIRPAWVHELHARMIATRVRAWLSVVSEDEIEAAARAIFDLQRAYGTETCRLLAKDALAASRRVLLPKERP